MNLSFRSRIGIRTLSKIQRAQILLARLFNARLPTPVLNGDIPYQKLINKIPDYKFLRVFGCSCFPLRRTYNTYKFEPRSQECIFLGYSMPHKRYRCLAADGCLYISKDVIFNEDQSPYPDLFSPPKPTSSPSTPTNPLSILPIPIAHVAATTSTQSGAYAFLHQLYLNLHLYCLNPPLVRFPLIHLKLHHPPL